MNVSISVPRLNVNYETPTIHDPLKRGAIRPDAELVRSYIYDRRIVRDEGVVLPQQGSGIFQLKESEILSPTIELDNNYYYYILSKLLTVPIFNSTDKWQGREEYCITVQNYELVYIPAGMFKSLIDGTVYNTPVYGFNTTGSMTQQILWQSDDQLAVYELSAYGATQMPRMPVLNNQIIYIYSPAFQLYGNENIFHNGALTDIRYQYTIDVWKVRRESMGINGWAITQELEHGIQCAQSEDHKLT